MKASLVSFRRAGSVWLRPLLVHLALPLVVLRLRQLHRAPHAKPLPRPLGVHLPRCEQQRPQRAPVVAPVVLNDIGNLPAGTRMGHHLESPPAVCKRLLLSAIKILRWALTHCLVYR